jgi:hypothetical protein
MGINVCAKSDTGSTVSLSAFQERMNQPEQIQWVSVAEFGLRKRSLDG